MTINKDVPVAANRIKIVSMVLLILVPLAVLGTRLELWHFRLGLLIMAVSILGSLIIQIINSIWLLRKPDAATKSLLRKSSLIALPPLLIIASVIRGVGTGAIHNISTDKANPPTFIAAQTLRGGDSNALKYTDKIAATQQKLHPEVSPISSVLSAEQAFTKSVRIANELGWDIYNKTPSKGHLEAADTTFWFGFKDDIVIRVTPTSAGSQIDLRSVSRVGKSDLGANANRILIFAKMFQQE